MGSNADSSITDRDKNDIEDNTKYDSQNESDLTIEMFMKFYQTIEDQEKTKIIADDEVDNYLRPLSDSFSQFGDLLTCDLVIQHHDRQYFSHKLALSSILDMNALGADSFVIEYKRGYHPYLEKTVEMFTINEEISLFQLAQFLFYGYYKRFPFENFPDNRVAEFMSEIVTQHGDSVPESNNEMLNESIAEIYNEYLKDVFLEPKSINVEDFKQRLIGILQISVKFKVVLIIDEILEHCDFRINWFEMYTPFSGLKGTCGGTLGKVVDKLLNNIANNFEEIIETTADFSKHIEEFSYDDLSTLLKKDHLRVTNEMQVWKVFHTWAMSHQNKVVEICDFVCHVLRYGLLQPGELHEVFAWLFAMLPKDVYQTIFMNLKRNYMTINNLLCTGKLVHYKDRIIGDSHFATRLRKFTEIILIFGGWMVGTQANFIECFIPSLDLMLDIVEFPIFDMGAYFGCEYMNGHLYIFGGSLKDSLTNICMSLKLKDASKYKWKKLADMSSNRCYVASCVFRDTLVAIGGFDGQERLATVEFYNPLLNQWFSLARMAHARSDGCAVVLNDRIYVAGGINTNCIEQTMEYYDPQKKKWFGTADMLIPRTSFAMVAFNGRIWALGGNSGARRVSSCDSYDPATDSWQIEASLNEARSTFKAIVYKNNIYIFGGYNGGGPMATVEKYCPETGVWTIENNLHFDRSGHSVVTLPHEAASRFEIPPIESIY